MQCICNVLFSLPDTHMRELHLLLPNHQEYLDKIVVKREEDIPADADRSQYILAAEDYRLRRKNVNENGHIVSKFAMLRMEKFLEKVLKGSMGLTDYAVRVEFQSRTALHFHIVGKLLCDVTADEMETAFTKYFYIDDHSTLSEGALKAKITLAKCEGRQIVPRGEKEEVMAKVKACEEKVVEMSAQLLGLNSVHPQSDPALWPDNGAPAPDVNVLRLSFSGMGDLDIDYEFLVNRVQRHKHTQSYCQRTDPNTGVTYCRFGYPEQLIGYRREGPDGTLVRVPDTFLEGAEVIDGELVNLRNHGYVVQHVPELLLLTRGNCDARIINRHQSLMNYLSKYVMKAEVQSGGFKAIMKKIMEEADDSCENRKSIQRIFLKMTSEHDLSKVKYILVY